MREFSLPALYEVPADGNLTDIVRRNAAQHPDVAVIARKVGGTWHGRHRHRLPRRGAGRGQGSDRLGRAAGRPGRPDVPYPLRVDAARLRDLERGRGHRAGVRDQLGGAGAVDPRRLGRDRLRRRAGRARGRRRVGARPAARASSTSGRSRPAASRSWAARARTSPTRRSRSAARSPRPTTRRPSSTPAGTTGRPKGCVLTHRSFFAECGNIVERLRPLFRTGECSVLLFLPLAHVFGRLVAGRADDGADQAGPSSPTSRTSPTNWPRSGRR